MNVHRTHRANIDGLADTHVDRTQQMYQEFGDCVEVRSRQTKDHIFFGGTPYY